MIVEDNPRVRHALVEAVADLGRLSLVGTAMTTGGALSRAASCSPEAVWIGSLGTQDNAQQLAKELAQRGMQVLLAQGPSDVASVSSPPHVSYVARRDSATEQIDAIATALGLGASEPVTADESREESQVPPQLIVVAASTGGPDALMQVLPKLPADLRAPILVVQHLPTGFSESLANRLQDASQLAVRVATTDAKLRAGEVLIAPGGKQTVVKSLVAGLAVAVEDGPASESCRPSANYTLQSVGDAVGGDVLVVMMTGMGFDGTEGCVRLRQLGAQILAQDEATSTVFGMPRGPIERGVVDRVVPLHGLAEEILQRTKVPLYR